MKLSNSIISFLQFISHLFFLSSCILFGFIDVFFLCRFFLVSYVKVIAIVVVAVTVVLLQLNVVLFILVIVFLFFFSLLMFLNDFNCPELFRVLLVNMFRSVL